MREGKQMLYKICTNSSKILKERLLNNELERLNKRFNDAKETDGILKMQMDIRKRKDEHTQIHEENYKKYVDSTLDMLGERDRKVAEEK